MAKNRALLVLKQTAFANFSAQRCQFFLQWILHTEVKDHLAKFAPLEGFSSLLPGAPFPYIRRLTIG
jgi:hypothetical protein